MHTIEMPRPPGFLERPGSGSRRPVRRPGRRRGGLALEVCSPRCRVVRCRGVVCRRCEWAGVERAILARGRRPSWRELRGSNARVGPPRATVAVPGRREPGGRATAGRTQRGGEPRRLGSRGVPSSALRFPGAGSAWLSETLASRGSFYFPLTFKTSGPKPRAFSRHRSLARLDSHLLFLSHFGGKGYPLFVTDDSGFPFKVAVSGFHLKWLYFL